MASFSQKCIFGCLKCCLSANYPKLEDAPARTAPGQTRDGLQRLCMVGMQPSHNTGRAKLVFDEITEVGRDVVETWVAIFPRAANSYYDFVEALKAELPEEQRQEYSGRHGWSSPFVWLELPDGSRRAVGGRQELCAWAVRTFPDSDKLKQWAATEPPSSEATSVDLTKPGSAGATKA